MRLLRTLSCIAAITVISRAAVAQTEAVPKPASRFGIIAGLNRANFGGEDAEGSETRTGLLLGATLTLPLAPAVSFQPELLFSQKGARIDEAGDEGEITMNYVELPLLFRADFPVQGKVRPFVYAGPALSYQATCDIKITSGALAASFTCEEFAEQVIGDPSLEFEKFDYGILFGGGIGFDLGGQALSIGARYNYGLRRISSDGDLKHRVLSVVATLEFPFGRR
jgi:hypothetical protein